MSFTPSIIASSVLAGLLAAGPYSSWPGERGSEAIPGNDLAFVAWADGWSNYLPGIEVSETFQTPDLSLGVAQPLGGSVYDIVSLGRGGSIVLHFSHPIADGAGADFAVFENSVSDEFLELAFVEVSSNGTDFFRFPNDSLTSGEVGPYANIMDPSEVDGLAGKYRLGYGTPFDLAKLDDDPNLDRTRIHYVRLIDVVGDGKTLDSSGDPIYDPYPTVGSAGFDLDAVGALHLAHLPTPLIMHFTVGAAETTLEWPSVAWCDYVIEGSDGEHGWTVLESHVGVDGTIIATFTPDASLRFFRVRSVGKK